MFDHKHETKNSFQAAFESVEEAGWTPACAAGFRPAIERWQAELELARRKVRQIEDRAIAAGVASRDEDDQFYWLPNTECPA
jgi:hypothetical protein